MFRFPLIAGERIFAVTIRDYIFRFEKHALDIPEKGVRKNADFAFGIDDPMPGNGALIGQRV